MPQFHFLRRDLSSLLLSILLFALYIDEIGFFCSPMEDNHCGNCHPIAKFHCTVKGRNTDGKSIKKTVIASLSPSLSVAMTCYLHLAFCLSFLHHSPFHIFCLSLFGDMSIRFKHTLLVVCLQKGNSVTCSPSPCCFCCSRDVSEQPSQHIEISVSFLTCSIGRGR